MSSPRPIFPNTTYTAARRTTQRRFLLRPDPAVVDIFLFCLAYAAHKHGVLLHAWITMIPQPEYPSLSPPWNHS